MQFSISETEPKLFKKQLTYDETVSLPALLINDRHYFKSLTKVVNLEFVPFAQEPKSFKILDTSETLRSIAIHALSTATSAIQSIESLQSYPLFSILIKHLF